MMHRPSIIITLLALSVISLAGCSSKPSTHTSYNNKSTSTKPVYTGNLKTRLNTHLKRWRGAPYKLGDLNRRGIDCSGFVYVTYRDVFGRKMPRSTQLLAKVGRDIPKHKLKFGDLVFFKTGRRQRHVGIYVGKGKFVHASTSKGVTTSQLGSNYWTSHYWKSVRL